MNILLGKTLTELQAIALELGLKKFVGTQLAQWLYQQRVTSFDEMTNIAKSARELLASHYIIGRHAPVRQAVSLDGTIKYLFEIPKTLNSKLLNETATLYGLPIAPLGAENSKLSTLNSNRFVEAVYIPEDDRATLCVSTQAGCKMGCKFCMTGTLGFHGHLPASEILNQIFEVESLNSTLSTLNSPNSLTNLVYMGEGEPMDNLDAVLRSLEIMQAPYSLAWSPKRITVSSVGLIPGLKRYLEESDCHLAISLHNPFHVERAAIMPAEKAYPIDKVIALLKQYDFSHQRRVSFEYICWSGVNDTPKHANELIRLLRGLDCRINLIRFHEGVDVAFPASDKKQMVWFRDYLSDHGITTTIRRSRGEDILAACGMLVNSLNNPQSTIHNSPSGAQSSHA
ncbi:MAG: 23S rRNA (adenine(2503)-C(2))-methyltransferase RlmN [Paludibacteraceae bacterium]|nr:23S rRNA (adenine(2503)-C(2))-methyltransferase RlmN [Paludibacteraceae bacterium]